MLSNEDVHQERGQWFFGLLQEEAKPARGGRVVAGSPACHGAVRDSGNGRPPSTAHIAA